MATPYLCADWAADWNIRKIRFVFVNRAPYTTEKPIPTPNLEIVNEKNIKPSRNAFLGPEKQPCPPGQELLSGLWTGESI